jgi:hypothetical protein
MKNNMRTNSIKVLAFVCYITLFSICFAGANAGNTNDQETIVRSTLDEFKRTGDYSLLVKAYNAIHLGSNSQASIELKLDILEFCYQTRDWAYDLNADHSISINVGMPPSSNDVVFAGMDPKDVKDPVLRKQYEDAIAANNRRKEKDVRERTLQHMHDGLINDIVVLMQAEPKDSAVRKHTLDLINTTIQEKKLQEELKGVLEK